MKKKEVNAFGRKYLLGVKDGEKYWLCEPSWDCGWYWGCGYVQVLSNNTVPERSRDITMHTHFDSLFFEGPSHGYDNFNKFFDETVLTDKETWTLMELMKTVYTLRDTAEDLGRGCSHYTTNPCKDMILNEDEVTRINEVVLPALFREIANILREDCE